MPTVLIVEDDQSIARVICRELQNGLTAMPLETAAAAGDVVRGEALQDVVAAIIDVGLPDGNGLDLVAALRRRRASLPILVLTGSNDPAIINRAHALRAEFVVKPFFRDNLRSFLMRLPSEPSLGERMSDVIEKMASAHNLTAREKEILSRASKGVPRSHLPEALGVSENTVKSQIRSLLAKTECGSLADVVWRVLGQIGAPEAH